ncbi:MAG: protein arginine kinase [bacterium]|nr:MAG: protein arginine kinase [bacterium]
MAREQKNPSFNHFSTQSSLHGLGINSLLQQPPKWLEGTGKHSDIVISSRVRLARNLRDYSFPNRASDKVLNQVLEVVKDCYQKIDDLKDSIFLNINNLDELDRQFLMERRLISPNFIKLDRPGGLIIGKDELISLMINEEDHLRIQSIQSGLEINKAWQLIHHIDDALANSLEFAYSDQFGYLTACPTNTGTGIRVSVFINLSALAIAEKIDKIIHEMAPSEVAIRGFYGEGTDILGNIFQISNQLTLGKTEQSIINRINNMAEQLIEFEQNARKNLLEEDSVVVEDKVARAIGTLKYAKILTSVEVVNFLSLLRLGAALNLIDHIDEKILNELLVLIQPAHLQKLHGGSLSSRDRDILRVKLIRKRLKF